MLNIEPVLKNQDYMTPEQLTIADEFENMIDSEYALCTREMKRANKAALSGATSTNSDEELAINYACLEVDAIREYWFNRLVTLIKIIEYRNPKLNKELASKYLNNEQ